MSRELAQGLIWVMGVYLISKAVLAGFWWVRLRRLSSEVSRKRIEAASETGGEEGSVVDGDRPGRLAGVGE